MSIYGYLTSDLSKDDTVEIITMCDKVYCSLNDIENGMKSFTYGDILVVSESIKLRNSFTLSLNSKGILIREFKGNKTNLMGTLYLDSIINDYLNTVGITLEEYANKKGIDYTDLLNYTEEGGLLSKCNADLYQKLVDFNNKDTQLLKDVKTLCDTYNITIKALIGKLSVIEDTDVVVTDSITKTDELTDDKCLSIVNKFISKYNTDTLDVICKRNKVDKKFVLNYINKTLVVLDIETYEAFKIKELEIDARKTISKMDNTKFNIVVDYIKGNKTLTELTDKAGISFTSLYKFINTTLKDEFPSLYKRYKLYSDSNRGGGNHYYL